MAVHRFTCIDAHTCGNPVRVVTEGGPRLDGSTMMERRAEFMQNHDWIRTGLMFEPRGHDQMSGSLIYESTRPDCDVGILFIETSGCLPMCGHGAIGTVTVLIQKGLVRPERPGLIRLDTPAGRVDARYDAEDGRVRSVRFVNVPSFVSRTGCEVDCPDLGRLLLDVAYGGNFYAIVEPQENYGDMADHSALDFIRWSRVVRRQLNERYTFEHPEDTAIGGCTHVLWSGRPTKNEADARNAVFYGDGAIDRSPCGTGTSSRMAQLFARGDLAVGDSFVHESIIGSLFRGRIESETSVGDVRAIVPSIEGWARITGYNRILIDEDDPYAHGFRVL